MYEIMKNGCWVWKGKTRSSGRYGYVSIKGKTESVHRIVCELKNGPSEKNMFACHKCGNSLCINPDHLYWGTAKNNYEDSKENMMLKINWGKRGVDNPNSKYPQDLLTKCIELRKTGMSFSKIAKECGFKSKGHAWTIWKTHLKYSQEQTGA